MWLSLQMEQFLYGQSEPTVVQVARQFGISEGRCRQELEGLAPFGILVRSDGRIFIGSDGDRLESAMPGLRQWLARVEQYNGCHEPGVPHRWL